MAESNHAEVNFAATVTLDDHLHFNEYILRQPEARRRRRRFTILALLLCAPMSFCLGVTGKLATSDWSSALSDAVDLIRSDPWRNALTPWFGIAIIFLILLGTLRLFRRPLLRTQLRRILQQRPGIKADDPQLSEYVRCTFGDAGYRVESAGYTHQIPWRAIKAVDQVGSVLVVRTGPTGGYVLPKRDISTTDLAEIRVIATRHIGSREPKGGA